MTSYEMVEKLSEKKGITLAQAKEVLEKCNWDILDAMIYLEKNPINNAQQADTNFTAKTTVNLNKEEQVNAENVQTASGIPNSNCGAQGSYSTPNQGSAGAQQTYTVPNGSQYQSSTGASFSEMLGRFFGFVGKIITKGIENTVEISKNGSSVANIPVIVMVLLLLMAFPLVITIMIISLFLNFTYSLKGPSFTKEKANEMMEKASKAADKIKTDFMNGVEYGGK